MERYKTCSRRKGARAERLLQTTLKTHHGATKKKETPATVNQMSPRAIHARVVLTAHISLETPQMPRNVATSRTSINSCIIG